MSDHDPLFDWEMVLFELLIVINVIYIFLAWSK